MGPNGSGKSTLAVRPAGIPEYEVTAGRILFKGDDITDWDTEIRGKAGMFLAFQYPQQVQGVSVHQLPPPGAVGPQGHRPVGARAAPVDHGVDGAARHGPVLRRPLPQRGLLRRREEAQRDPPDGDPRAGDRRSSTRPTPASTSTPCRSWPRACRRCGATAPSSASWPSRTTSACSTTSSPTWCTSSSTAASSTPVARSWPSARARGLRGAGGDAMSPLDVAAIKKDFPILEREVARQPARLPRLGHHVAEAPRRARRDGTATTSTRNANVHRGIYLIAEEATAALEGARAKVARFIGAAHAREVVFTKNATEALNLVAKAWGRANLHGGRRRRAHRARAPRQHRAVAPAPRRAGHRAPLDPGAVRRPPRPHRPRPARRRRQGRGLRGHVERARHALPVERLVDRRPRRRRHRRRRRLPVRPPRRHRRAGVGRRLRRLHRPQDVRPHRHRRAVGHRARCSTPPRRSSAAAR